MDTIKSVQWKCVVTEDFSHPGLIFGAALWHCIGAEYTKIFSVVPQKKGGAVDDSSNAQSTVLKD